MTAAMIIRISVCMGLQRVAPGIVKTLLVYCCRPKGNKQDSNNTEERRTGRELTCFHGFCVSLDNTQEQVSGQVSFEHPVNANPHVAT